MLQVIDRFLHGGSTGHTVVIALLLVSSLASIDLLMGFEWSFSVFYTLPIALAAWYAGRVPAYVLCLVCAATWLGVDYASGREYSHPSTPVWNAGVWLAFFLIIASLLLHLRDTLEAQAQLARRDGLTGLLNASGFEEECGRLFQLARRHGHPLTLGYLDLDGFKAVNDKLGHSAGNQVLQTIAQTLQQNMRASDCCARLGGDEFAIVLPETGLPGAQTYFAGLRQHLAELVAHNDWPVGFSFGAAVFDPPPADLDQALRLADALMYDVKKSGKNNIQFEEYARPRAVSAA